MLSFHYLISTWCCCCCYERTKRKIFFSCLMLCNKVFFFLDPFTIGAMNCVYWTHPLLFVNNLWCRKYSVQYYFLFLTPWNDPQRTNEWSYCRLSSFHYCSILSRVIFCRYNKYLHTHTHALFSECEKI